MKVDKYPQFTENVFQNLSVTLLYTVLSLRLKCWLFEVNFWKKPWHWSFTWSVTPRLPHIGKTQTNSKNTIFNNKDQMLRSRNHRFNAEITCWGLYSNPIMITLSNCIFRIFSSKSYLCDLYLYYRCTAPILVHRNGFDS